MTRDEAKKILGENATDEQITGMLNAFHQQKSELDRITQLNDKFQKDLDSERENSNKYKSELDKINEANLTKEQQLEKREKEILARDEDSKIRNNKAQVKEKLASLNLDSDTLNSLVDSITTGDTEKSLANASIYVSTFTAMRENTIKATKEELINVNAKPSVSNAPKDDVMTFEKFRSMTASEQAKFAEEHPEEFRRL